MSSGTGGVTIVLDRGYLQRRSDTRNHGRKTYYEPRSFSPASSQLGMHAPPSGYYSGRNTPQSNLFPMAEMQPSIPRPVTNYLDMPMPGMP